MNTVSSYQYLFKFIIIGDSGKLSFQLLVNLVSYFSSLINVSKKIMTQLQELNLELNQFRLTIRLQNYKYEILLDKNHLSLLLDPITEGQLELQFVMMLREENHLSILQNDLRRLKSMEMQIWQQHQLEIRQTWSQKDRQAQKKAKNLQTRITQCSQKPQQKISQMLIEQFIQYTQAFILTARKILEEIEKGNFDLSNENSGIKMGYGLPKNLIKNEKKCSC